MLRSIGYVYLQTTFRRGVTHGHPRQRFDQLVSLPRWPDSSTKINAQPGGSKNSRRTDIPKDHIPAPEQRTDNLKYFDSDAQESKDLRPLEKLLSQILDGK
jgi:hypothetical protein